MQCRVQLAQGSVTRNRFAAILNRIARLAMPPHDAVGRQSANDGGAYPSIGPFCKTDRNLPCYARIQQQNRVILSPTHKIPVEQVEP